MAVLGIETSCDETGVAIYKKNVGLLANQLFSQIKLHRPYGGIVPEYASRDHIKRILPLVKAALIEANMQLSDLSAIAYTAGPGLIGSLMVGASVANAIAFSQQIPVVAIHHMEAHLMAAKMEYAALTFPFIGLLVSGGHTMLVKAVRLGEYTVLGESVDDAAGECLDKSAKIMGLPYPGGPEIAKLAEMGDVMAYQLPRPMLKQKGLNFSYSGLKTAVLQLWQKSKRDEKTKRDLAACLQMAVVDTLVTKCIWALEKENLVNLVVAGGVAANQMLRTQLRAHAAKQGRKVYFPSPDYCTDNGAMIAYCGAQRYYAGDKQDYGLNVFSRWSMSDLVLPEN